MRCLTCEVLIIVFGSPVSTFLVEYKSELKNISHLPIFMVLPFSQYKSSVTFLFFFFISCLLSIVAISQILNKPYHNIWVLLGFKE